MKRYASPLTADPITIIHLRPTESISGPANSEEISTIAASIVINVVMVESGRSSLARR